MGKSWQERKEMKIGKAREKKKKEKKEHEDEK